MEDLDFRSRFMRNLNDLMVKRELCDVILRTRDHQNSVLCHGVVLATVSEDFKAQLSKTSSFEFSQNRIIEPTAIEARSPTQKLTFETPTAIANLTNGDDGDNGEEEKNIVTIDLPTESSLVLNGFISYVYTGRIELNEDTVLEFASLSTDLHIATLQDFCETFMVSYINIHNCFQYNRFSKNHEFLRLQHHAKLLGFVYI